MASSRKFEMAEIGRVKYIVKMLTKVFIYPPSQWWLLRAFRLKINYIYVRCWLIEERLKYNHEDGKVVLSSGIFSKIKKSEISKQKANSSAYPN